MNILLWYLPFAMFTETCDLMIDECKDPPQDKRDETPAGRPVADVAPRLR